MRSLFPIVTLVLARPSIFMSVMIRSIPNRWLTKIALVSASLCSIGNGMEAIATTTPAKIAPQTRSSVPAAINTLIVPGKRAGAITAKTTYTNLEKIYGKQRLTPTKVYGAEGQVVFPGTLVKLAKNRSVTVAWKDAKKLQPLQVIINDSTWKTAEGIGLGTNLTKLRQVLGEFKITGLGWDYGNQVIQIPPPMRARYYGLSISVSPDRLAAQRFPKDLLAVSGDGVTPSASNPHWKPLKMRVSGLSVYFNESKSSTTEKQ
ncbi:hypothetical protein [Chamaesiphon minutus]|nr:hypothetical protein [Chamaesiphon minutus]